MKRIVAGVIAPALLLSGCAGGAANSTWSQYYQVLKQSFSGSFSDKGVSRQQAADVPYASLGYRVNGGPEALIVLATDNNGEQLWTSGAHIVIVTQDGRVNRTVGLPRNIGPLAPARGPALPAPADALAAPVTLTMAADFPDISRYAVTITCRMSPAGRESVSILGRTIPATRVDETCDSPGLDWRYRNSYWLDDAKFVWRSVQHIHPKGDTLEIEIFRPPG